MNNIAIDIINCASPSGPHLRVTISGKDYLSLQGTMYIDGYSKYLHEINVHDGSAQAYVPITLDKLESLINSLTNARDRFFGKQQELWNLNKDHLNV